MLPNESVVRVPVQVDLENGGQARGELVVTVFTPQGEGRHPLMVISHGRAGDAAGRAKLGRALCDGGPLFHRRRFRRGRAGAAGLRRHRRSRPGKQRPCGDRRLRPCSTVRERDRAGDRGDGAAAGRGSVVALGQSVGGGSTVALAAAGPAGARRHQFRGRFGRRSGQVAGQALRPERLQETYAGYAATTRMPMLWIYTENDLYWGRNGRNAGPRPTTPPAAMRIRTPGAGRRQRPLAVHACAREMEAAGARLPARAGLRHAGAGQSIRPARVPERKRGREGSRPPAVLRQATPPGAQHLALIQPPSGPARNATTPAMSSGWPSAPAAAAWRSARSVRGFARHEEFRGHRPGATALTVTRRPRSSLAKTRVKPSTAALLPM